MGKRSKKSSHALKKGKSTMVYPQKRVSEQCVLLLDPIRNGVAESEGRKSCPHMNKYFKMNNLLEKLGSTAMLKCEDCRDSLPNRNGSKGKRKNVKVDGVGCSSTASKFKPKAIWVCLECSHHACGGVGLPAEPQSHAIRHARKTHHSLMIQLQNPHLLWCLHCNALIPVETSKDSLHTSGVFSGLVHFIETRVSEWSMHNEDVTVDGDEVVLESHTNGEGSALNHLANGCKNVVRGLVNLGNTCFFNSILQNILAMGKLRDHFSNQDVTVGPLSIFLKKLFAETEAALSLRNVINPGSFFSCLCSKAPRFRGYQQHDSHELLCCLLDRLSAEELAFRKQASIYEEVGNSSMLGPAFIEALFEGQFCSTVCCVECGHSSTVYEAFLDLSLPVPMRKNSVKKKVISRTKKKKCPPKSVVTHRRKPNKGTQSVLQQRNSTPSFCIESPNESQSTICDGEFAVALSGESTVSNSLSPTMVALECGGLVSHSSCSSVVEYEDHMASLGKSAARMDRLGPEVESKKLDAESIFQTDGISISQYSGRTCVGLKSSLNGSFQCSVFKEQSLKLDLSHPLEDAPPQVQSSDVLLLPYKEDKNDEDSMATEAEASSFFVGNEQVEVGLDDGIGILFNEPEASEMPVPRSSLGIEIAETGNMIESNSESDSDEVDTDSPVHLETCLNHYIKPELLTGDNAWECRNCSKMLHSLEQYAKQIGKRTAPESSVAKGEYLVSNNQNHDGPNQDCAKDEHHQVGRMESLYPLECQKCSKNGPHMEHPKFFEPVPNSCDFKETTNNGFTVNNDQHTYCFGNCDPDEHGKTCVKLNVKKSATKRALIVKAPPILTIHLKRFNQDAHGHLSKLNGHVEFGEIIDLSPYMDFRCEHTKKHLYRLLGVVEHTGSMRGGHYVAYIRGSKKRNDEEKDGTHSAWYLANDSHVYEVSLEEVFGSEAYILFYERI